MAREARAALSPLRMPLTGGQVLPLAPRHGVMLAVFLAMSAGEAQAAPAAPSIILTMLKWTPLLAQGFALNIAMSFLAMAIGTVFGFALGLGQISLLAPLRAARCNRFPPPSGKRPSPSRSPGWRRCA
jgi:hypothetical protein